MAKALDLPYPPRWINAYIFNKLAEYEDVGVDATQEYIPIFASSPTNFEDIYQGVTQTIGIAEPLVIQYDRVIQARTGTLYPRKREQVLYYLYSTSIANVNNASIIISQILDREDAAAQDLNAWILKNPQYLDGKVLSPNVFFETVRAYHSGESKDVMHSVSARTVYVNKLVIEYEFHAKDGSTYR
jgi:hypothetical protein